MLHVQEPWPGHVRKGLKGDRKKAPTIDLLSDGGLSLIGRTQCEGLRFGDQRPHAGALEKDRGAWKKLVLARRRLL